MRPGSFASPITIARALERRRRRLALVLAITALAGAVAAVHSTAGEQHMGKVAACLAVVELGAAVVVLARVAGRVGHAPRPTLMPVHAGADPVARARPRRARDGPPRLEVLRL